MTHFNHAHRLTAGLAVAAWLFTAVSAWGATPLGTGWTYQAELEQNGSRVNDLCDCQFSLWDDPAAGTQVGLTLTFDGQGGNPPPISVSNGLFTVELDFGAGAFDGNARWLEIAVACPPGGALTPLTPRQALTPAPHALALPGFYTQQNTTSPNVIGGVSGNAVTAGVLGATISGGGMSEVGFENRVTDDYGTIGGGRANQAGDGAGTTSDNPFATVSGGEDNTASGRWSTVGGGLENTASGIRSAVGGGVSNTASASDSTVGGGQGNTASGFSSTVPGGWLNTAAGGWSFAAGRRAKANHQGAFVWGDSTNVDFASTGDNQFLIRAGGGVGIGTTSPQATLHVAEGTSGTGLILPGLRVLQNSESPNVIGGFSDNAVTDGVLGATIGGGGFSGWNNRVTDDYGTVGGGQNNQAGDGAGTTSDRRFATVSGGENNTASGLRSTVGGGGNNTAGGQWSSIGGGSTNTASGHWSIVGGGWSNTTSGNYSTVGGGQLNTASGTESSVPGGRSNTAAGDFSFAAGHRAKANHQGAFVWGDNTNVDFASTGDNQFLIRAGGGVGIGTTSPQATLHVDGTTRVSTLGGTGTRIVQASDSGDLVGLAAGTTSEFLRGDGIWAPPTMTESDPTWSGEADTTGNIGRTGNVGIGTSPPLAKLHVGGTPGTDGIMFPDGTLQTTAATGGGDFWAASGDDISNTNSGNVGIGTATPAARLDVNGSGRVATLEVTGGAPLNTQLAAWGLDDFGQTNVPAGAFTAVAAGYWHSLAINSDGTLVGWGDNRQGQISVPAGTFIAVAAHQSHSLAIRSDGTLAGWGNNEAGQADVPAGTFTAVAAGGAHGLAIRSDGTLAGWGWNATGQTDVPAGTFTAVAAGTQHSLAIRSDGTLVGWGWNVTGQTDVPAGTFTAVAAGLWHSLAIRSNGTLAGWGDNTYGQTNVPAGTFTAVAVGDAHSLAIRSDGTLVGWGGENTHGETNVPAGTFTAVAAGGAHGLVISADDPDPAIPALLLHNDQAYKPGSDRWTIWSDRRLKDQIQPLSGALDRLLALRGVSFEWRDAQHGGGRTGPQIGLVADEVQTVFPAWVGRGPEGYQTLTVSGFEALSVEALRELSAAHERLRAEKNAEIDALQERIAELEATVERLAGIVVKAQAGTN